MSEPIDSSVESSRPSDTALPREAAGFTVSAVSPGRRRLRRALLGLTGLGSLVAGVWLIVGFILSQVPDASSGPADRVIAFIMSDRFNELTDAERQAYAEALVKRLADMTPEQRKLVEAQLKAFRDANPDQVREQTIRFWKDYVVSEAGQYLQVPPDQRRAYLETKVAGWEMLFGGGRDGKGGTDDERRQRERQREQERWDEVLEPDQQAKVLDFFQNDVMPRTSARDRALVTLMARDLRDLQQ